MPGHKISPFYGTLTLLAFLCFIPRAAYTQSFSSNIAPLIESSCIACHDSATDTDLNFEALGHDLADATTFRKWEQVFDRVNDGEMPPESEERPDSQQVAIALKSLKHDLKSASLMRQQRVGRVPARRLTKLELGYTLRDLFLIEVDVTSDVPDEVESGSFDSVGATQRISAVHLDSYLSAADQALNFAIQRGANPYRDYGEFAHTNFAHLNEWHEKPLNDGGSVTRKLETGIGVVLFADIDYLTRFTYGVTAPGKHRLTATVAAYQSKEPVTAKFIVKDPAGGARLVKSVDLNPGEPQKIVIETFLNVGDSPYLTFDKGGQSLAASYAGVYAAGGAKHYKGPGLAIMTQKLEGPIFDSWPPQSTRQLLEGVEFVSNGGAVEISATHEKMELVGNIVRNIASKVFRRPVEESELEGYLKLSDGAVAEERDIVDVIRIPLRSMLSSPQFLLFSSEPGELDDYALANRLSYFLWKSMPDEKLFSLADDGKLSDAKILAQQIDRMLADDKANRFVRDFLGQWLRLYQINATTPDDKLYPEYDELLGNALTHEPELFFTELINENLSVTNLIDSDFTFVNRRLAEHYGIPDVSGQEFRKVDLPTDSPRGGVLTQAAILKTTANGTVTSPVTRGNFVLTNFIGTPPAPPPPNVGSIEPDTRGKTTIREILTAHRDIETCAKCHKEIDPPGFALESFDPIGGFRTNYRAAGGGLFGIFTKNTYRNGPTVDASGVTTDGKKFAGIKEFKQHLLDQKEQVARNFISQLVVYSTGAEIQFADREGIEAILDQHRADDFPVRDIIHSVVQSRLFKHQ